MRLLEQSLTTGGIAFATAGILAYPIYRILVAAKARQVVSRHLELHQMKMGTPTMGGWIFVSTLVLLSVFPQTGVRRWVGITVLLFALLGWLDDYLIPKLQPGSRGLDWKSKLFLQFALAVGASIWYALAENRVVTPGRVAWDVFCILFFANAYNFVDGLDWLAFTVGLGLFAGVGGLAVMFGQSSILIVLVALGAAMLPFGVLNKPKAKLFMGDTGSMPVGALIGLFIASISWHSGFRPEVLVSLSVVSFVMAAELLPPPLQIFWVKVFGRRLFLMTPIHHAFEKAGWRETRVVALFALVQLVCSALALFVAWRWG